MVFEQIFLSLPGGFILRVVAPHTEIKLILYEVHTPLRGTSLSFPGSSILIGEYWPSLHGTSSTGKRETHHELLTVLLAILACMQLLPCIQKLCMVPKNVVLDFP